MQSLEAFDCNYIWKKDCDSECTALAHELNFVFQFGETVRVWTSSSKRDLPWCPVSTGRGQDTAMRGEGKKPFLPLSLLTFLIWHPWTLSCLPCRRTSCWLSLHRALTEQRERLRPLTHGLLLSQACTPYHRRQHYILWTLPFAAYLPLYL